MLETISKGFQRAKLRLQGKTILSEENIKNALKDVRQSLLSADVDSRLRRSPRPIRNTTTGQILHGCS